MLLGRVRFLGALNCSQDCLFLEEGEGTSIFQARKKPRGPGALVSRDLVFEEVREDGVGDVAFLHRFFLFLGLLLEGVEVVVVRGLREVEALLEVGGDDAHEEGIPERGVGVDAELDVEGVPGEVGDDLDALLGFHEADARAAGDGADGAPGPADRGLEEVAVDGVLRRFLGFVGAAPHPEADEGDAAMFEGRLHVGEVEVDHRGIKDELGDRLDRLGQDAVRLGEGLVDRDVACHPKQFVVAHDDDRVDDVLQGVEAFDGVFDPDRPFEGEGAGHDGNGEGPGFLGALGDDRGGAGPGAFAHAGRDEDHVGSLDEGLDLLDRFLGRFLAAGRVATGAEAVGLLVAEDHPDRGPGGREGLGIGIEHGKAHVLDAFLDHAVDGVIAGPADPDDHDLGDRVEAVELLRVVEGQLLEGRGIVVAFDGLFFFVHKLCLLGARQARKGSDPNSFLFGGASIGRFRGDEAEHRRERGVAGPDRTGHEEDGLPPREGLGEELPDAVKGAQPADEDEGKAPEAARGAAVVALDGKNRIGDVFVVGEEGDLEGLVNVLELDARPVIEGHVGFPPLARAVAVAFLEVAGAPRIEPEGRSHRLVDVLPAVGEEDARDRLAVPDEGNLGRPGPKIDEEVGLGQIAVALHEVADRRRRDGEAGSPDAGFLEEAPVGMDDLARKGMHLGPDPEMGALRTDRRGGEHPPVLEVEDLGHDFDDVVPVGDLFLVHEGEDVTHVHPVDHVVRGHDGRVLLAGIDLEADRREKEGGNRGIDLPRDGLVLDRGGLLDGLDDGRAVFDEPFLHGPFGEGNPLEEKDLRHPLEGNPDEEADFAFPDLDKRNRAFAFHGFLTRGYLKARARS